MRPEELRTPCYVADERKLEENLKILRGVAERTGAKILLAQKAFSMFALYPLIGRYLDGTAASGLYEARLGKEELGGETHVFSAAYRPDEFKEIVSVCDHIVFNSLSQLRQFGNAAEGRELGLRVNPERSTQERDIYDPCARFSRLGVTGEQLSGSSLEGVSGLHFHCLCEQNADALEETLDAVEERFGEYLPRMRWINFGGGHHITRPDYDTPRLEGCISRMQSRYGLTVYLEPGEAIALDAGELVTTVLDIVRNGMDIAVVDASAACHMPDVLEMPYRPPLSGADLPLIKPYTYRIGGPTCLAGDVVGDYSFDRPLRPGDRLVFRDMAIYTMVKNNTFNGMRLPDIAVRDKNGDCRIIRQFGYEDFRGRLS
jgi:carboxynorspermidine decarboxylase